MRDIILAAAILCAGLAIGGSIALSGRFTSHTAVNPSATGSASSPFRTIITDSWTGTTYSCSAGSCYTIKPGER